MDAFGRFVAWHAGRCALCGMAGELVVDHDHVTMQVRGLLCEGCNVIEGRSNPLVAIRYRLKHPADLAGLRVDYREVSAAPGSRPDLTALSRRWGTGYERHLASHLSSLVTPSGLAATADQARQQARHRVSMLAPAERALLPREVLAL